MRVLLAGGLETILGGVGLAYESHAVHSLASNAVKRRDQGGLPTIHSLDNGFGFCSTRKLLRSCIIIQMKSTGSNRRNFDAQGATIYWLFLFHILVIAM